MTDRAGTRLENMSYALPYFSVSLLSITGPRVPVQATAGFATAKCPVHGTAGTMQAEEEDPDSH